jgi:predicted nucleotidyltransferase
MLFSHMGTIREMTIPTAESLLRQPNSRSRHLQRLALRTQFFPFTLLYRFLYWAAIRLCLRRLGGLPGVLCVYLRRGLARGRPVYGLSDIDLLVLVDGANRERNAARVRNRYESLRRIIPMLAEGELALYHPEEFRALYTHCPFYRHRFDSGRRNWRRLRGEDAFSHLPPPHDSRTYLAGFELLSVWRYLSRELLPADPRPAYLRRYVAFKMIADAAAVWLAVNGDDGLYSRETALARAADANPDLRLRLRQIARWRGNLLSSGGLPVDDVLDAYCVLARAALSREPERLLPARELQIRALPAGEVERQLGAGAWTLIEEACTALEGVERAILTPRLDFDPLATVGLEPGQFAGATVDSFDLILVGKRLPRAERLREFNRKLRPLSPRLNAFFCDGGLALALQPVPGWTVKDPRTAPELFACIAQAPPGALLTTAGSVRVARPFERADSLEHRALSLLCLFLEPEIFQMTARDFFLVFWEALRAAYLSMQDRDKSAEVPVTSQQVVDALAAITVSEETVLRRILDEYSKDLRGEPSDIARYTVWASAYAGKLAGLVDPSRTRDGKLPEQPMTRLSVSVVIAARNRAEMLRRALESLLRQERLPDEVVVVDNASTDTTADVALSFRDRLNLKLVREDQVGIPHARNAGLRHAAGDILAFIDDDCEAEPGWLAEMEKPFLKDPHVGSVGGNLIPADGQTELVARFYSSRMDTESVAEGGHAE